jgi:hypothetical protein
MIRPVLDRRLALACGGLGTLLLVTSAGLLAAGGQPGRGVVFSIAAGVALLVAAGVLDPFTTAAFLRHPRSQAAWISVAVVGAALGALLVLNLAAERSTRQLDLTHAGLYTLSPSSATVAKNLDSDLVITGYFRPDERQRQQRVAALLSRYQGQNAHVVVRFVDPDQARAQAMSLGVDVADSLVLKYQDRPPVVLPPQSQTEIYLTGAMLRLEASHTPNVCWVGGDGERDLQSQDDKAGYSATRGLLGTSGYTFREVRLTQAQVPQDCDAVTVIGPSRPLGQVTRAALSEYLDRGGSVVVALDPWQDQKVTDSVNEVVARYGLAFSGGLDVEGDPGRHAADDPTVPAVVDYGPSPVVAPLSGQSGDPSVTFFPQPTSIATTPADGVTKVALATTTRSAYEIPTTRDSFGRGAGDRPGPFTLMATAEQPVGTRTNRAVVVGTSALGENRAVGAGGANGPLLLAGLDWLTEPQVLTTAGVKAPASAPIPATGTRLALNAVLTLLELPGLVAAVGFVVVTRRRARDALVV